MRRVAIIGTGFVADLYAASLKTFPDIAVVACYDRDVERLARFCAHWDLPRADTIEAALCEKPLATTAAEAAAEAIVATARRTHTAFMKAVATPFVPAARGDLGAVRHVAVDFRYPVTRATRPGCYAKAGGDVLLDRAVCGITLARIRDAVRGAS